MRATLEKVLTEENFLMLYVPVGFAHGFAPLVDQTIFSYKCSDVYHPESEGGLMWNDSEFGIDWAIKDPILSEKDKALPALKDIQSTLNF